MFEQIRKYTTLVLIAACALVCAFTATAFAAGAAEPQNGTLWDLLRPVYDAFANGHYLYAGSIALTAAAALARKYGGEKFPFLLTPDGAAVLVFVGSFGAALSTRLAGDVELERTMVWDATKIALLAMGGYAVAKAILVRRVLEPLAARYPSLATPIGYLTWIFKTPEKPPETPPAAVEPSDPTNPPA